MRVRAKVKAGRRLLPVTCTLRKEQIVHIDKVTNYNGDRSRWIRDAVDRKIWDEQKYRKELEAQKQAEKKDVEPELTPGKV